MSMILSSGDPHLRVIRLAGITIAIRHILFERGWLTQEVREWLQEEQPDVCISGHSHRPTIDHHGLTFFQYRHRRS